MARLAHGINEGCLTVAAFVHWALTLLDCYASSVTYQHRERCQLCIELSTDGSSLEVDSGYCPSAGGLIRPQVALNICEVIEALANWLSAEGTTRAYGLDMICENPLVRP